MIIPYRQPADGNASPPAEEDLNAVHEASTPDAYVRAHGQWDDHP
jgi:hypothetical protein